MPNPTAPPQRSFRPSNNGHSGPPSSKPKPKQEVVKTWAFDSVGNRKYAVQIKKATNGNPCVKIVEGVPAANGTYHKFDITIWSEDFARLFATLDEVRAFITANGIRTPDGHKWDPNRPKRNFKVWKQANRAATRGQVNFVSFIGSVMSLLTLVHAQPSLVWPRVAALCSNDLGQFA